VLERRQLCATVGHPFLRCCNFVPNIVLLDWHASDSGSLDLFVLLVWLLATTIDNSGTEQSDTLKLYVNDDDFDPILYNKPSYLSSCREP
jgi:hypothetical protein